MRSTGETHGPGRLAVPTPCTAPPLPTTTCPPASDSLAGMMLPGPGSLSAASSSWRFPNLMRHTCRYIDDGGDNNAAVGHRRWLLYPEAVAFGTGDVGDHPWAPSQRLGTSFPAGPLTPSVPWAWTQGSPRPTAPPGAWANTLWVFAERLPSRPATPAYVTWPSAGFVPYRNMPTSKRWSLSVPGAFRGRCEPAPRLRHATPALRHACTITSFTCRGLVIACDVPMCQYLPCSLLAS